MPGKLSAYAREAAHDHFFGVATYTPPAHSYVALSTTSTGDTGSGSTPPTDPNYARVVFDDWDSAVYSSGAARTANLSGIAFPAADANYTATVTHWEVWDAPTGGNLIAYGAFASPITVLAGETPQFDIGEFDISLGGTLAETVLTSLLDMLMLVNTYTAPAEIWTVLSTADPGSDGSGLTEPDTGDGYNPVDATGEWGAATSSAGTTTTANTSLLQFPAVTGNWGTITHEALMDGESGGTFLGSAALTTPRNVVTSAIQWGFNVGAIGAASA